MLRKAPDPFSSSSVATVNTCTHRSQLQRSCQESHHLIDGMQDGNKNAKTWCQVTSNVTIHTCCCPRVKMLRWWYVGDQQLCSTLCSFVVKSPSWTSTSTLLPLFRGKAEKHTHTHKRISRSENRFCSLVFQKLEVLHPAQANKGPSKTVNQTFRTSNPNLSANAQEEAATPTPKDAGDSLLKKNCPSSSSCGAQGECMINDGVSNPEELKLSSKYFIEGDGGT